MNLLDLMEQEEQAPKPASPSKYRYPAVCQCPNYYYPTMYVNSHVREDVLVLLDARNFRRLAELGVRFYNPVDHKWYSWTTKLYDDFIKTARRFPKCTPQELERRSRADARNW